MFDHFEGLVLKEFKINPGRIYILRDPLTFMKAQWFDTKTTVHARWPNNLRFKPPIFMKSCIFGNIKLDQLSNKNESKVFVMACIGNIPIILIR